MAGGTGSLLGMHRLSLLSRGPTWANMPTGLTADRRFESTATVELSVREL
jgi:hypothetical protein